MRHHVFNEMSPFTRPPSSFFLYLLSLLSFLIFYPFLPSPLTVSGKHRVAVIRQEGSNGDREMLSSFHAAGLEVREGSRQTLSLLSPSPSSLPPFLLLHPFFLLSPSPCPLPYTLLPPLSSLSPFPPPFPLLSPPSLTLLSSLQAWDVNMRDLLNGKVTLDIFRWAQALHPLSVIFYPHVCLSVCPSVGFFLSPNLPSFSPPSVHTSLSLLFTLFSVFSPLVLRGIVFCGGFSYADVNDSAKGWAGED
jgi:CobB/CobQ-like glutamine amidotransferase domain